MPAHPGRLHGVPGLVGRNCSLLRFPRPRAGLPRKVIYKMVRQVLNVVRFSGFLVLLGGMGCGPTEVVGKVPDTVQNLKKISAAYLEATTKLERPPANVEELKPFLKKYGDPATFLRSPDDGQEYKILWGVDFQTAIKGGTLPVLAYEQEGKDGKRYVLLVRRVVHMTEDEFRAAPFPPGHKAP